MGDLGALAVILAAGALYGTGVLRAWERAGRGHLVRPHQVACFAAGLAALLAALVSPIDTLADTSLTAHMVQHVLLIAVAAPLLVLGAPVVAIGHALDVSPPRWSRRWHARPAGPRWALAVTAGLLLHTAAIWLWHLPDAYDAAVANPALHAMEHASFLLTAMLLWWAVLGAGRRSQRGAGVLALFLIMFPETALGVMMAIAQHPWYPHYATGSLASAQTDQSLAGVVMWGFGGVLALVGACALFVSWLQALERTTPGRRELTPAAPTGDDR